VILSDILVHMLQWLNHFCDAVRHSCDFVLSCRYNNSTVFVISSVTLEISSTIFMISSDILEILPVIFVILSNILEISLSNF
jgi:hypothetical protein